MTHRVCTALTAAGRPCRARPMADGELCFLHDPEHREDADEARRLGRQHRRREATLRTAYGIDGLDRPGDVRRLLEVAAMESLVLPNGVARNRALAFVGSALLKAIEATDWEARLAEVERALGTQPGRAV